MLQSMTLTEIAALKSERDNLVLEACVELASAQTLVDASTADLQALREAVKRAAARMDGTEDAKHLAAGHTGEFLGWGLVFATETARKCAAMLREETAPHMGEGEKS